MKKITAITLIAILIIALAIANIPAPFIYRVNNIEFYDKNNNIIQSEIQDKHGEYIYLDDLSPHTINAFIAFEDKNFYSHHGFDTIRIIKAFLTNLFSLSFLQGASTISQQYARTIFLSNKKSISRKIKEAYYTIKLEKKYTKDQILEGYLNTIYLGHGCYGIDAASRYYFNKSAKDLSLTESATLASLPSSPNNSSPYINFEKSMSRKNSVLKAMKEEKYISTLEYKNAINTNVELNSIHEYETNIFYYLDVVKKEISQKNISKNKGLKVYTNFDNNLYKNISPIIDKYYTKSTQLSLIILENNTNKVLFNIGGFNYKENSYNRSIYSKRQVGSTIKTFLYSLALENNFTTKTKLYSKKTTFNIKNYGEYSPSNSNDIYAQKQITMEEAYAVSDNIYAVKTLLLLGSDNFINYLKKFNLNTQESVPSIALGSCSFALYDLAKAYSVYANNGYYYNYSFINKITDSLDNIIYTSSPNKQQIINKKTLTETRKLLSLPFYNNNYYTKATLENYNINGYYGKSGSTNTDSYLIIFNEKYTIASWIGTDNSNNLYDYTTSKYILRDITKTLN